MNRRISANKAISLGRYASLRAGELRRWAFGESTMAAKKRLATRKVTREIFTTRKKVATRKRNSVVQKASQNGWVHCPVCCKRYSRKTIVEHMESNHLPKLYRWCRECGEPLKKGKQNILRHLRERHQLEYAIVLKKRRDVREGKLGNNPDSVGKLQTYREGWTAIPGEILTGTPGSGKRR